MNRNGDCQVVCGLDDFLDVLKTNRFQVGLDRRLRLIHALDSWQGSFEPYRLRTLVCPLFATTAEEQRLFYELFEAHFPHFTFSSHANDQEMAPRIDPHGTEASNPDSGRYIYWTLAFLLLLTFTVLVLFFLRVRDPGPPQVHKLPPIAPAWSLKSPFQPPTKEPPPPPPPQSRPDFSDWLPVASSHPFTKISQPSNSWRWSFFLLLPTLFWSIAEVLAWSRRRAILVRATGQEFGSFPHRLPLKISANVSGSVAVALPSLRRPSPGPLRLHLPRTIYATVRTGFPQLRYEPIFRRPEYLVLIDKASTRDHQAIFFEELVKELDRRGLRVSAYFFSGDPRICRRLANGRTYYLADLFHQAGEQRLIILGEGESLISDEGDATTATSLLMRWPRRCILTPREPNEWSRHELHLAHYFHLLPATPEFLAASVDYFDPDEGQRLHSPKSDFDHREPDFNYASPPEIQRSVGEEIYRWICACALYPHLQWDITLRLGNKLDPHLLTNANIQKLIRLPWFRRGSMPLPLQQALADSLGKKGRRPLRQAIVDVLNDVRPMLEGSEGENHQLEVAIQQLDITPEERRKVLEDETVARVVSQHKVPRSAFLIPPAIRRILFPYGVPALGFRLAIRGALFVCEFLAAIIIASVWLSAVTSLTGQIGLNAEISVPPFWSEKSSITTPPNAAFGQLLTTLSGHQDSVNDARFSPDEKRVVTASSDFTARVWNSFTGQQLAILEGHTNKVTRASFSPDGSRIVTASWDHTARVWDAFKGRLLLTLQAGIDVVTSAAFSPDGQHIVTASLDHTTRVWNASSGQVLATMQDASAVFSAAFSPDGQRVVTASADKTARVWNASNGELLTTMVGHTDVVLTAAYSADGQRIVTGSTDNTARVWNASSGKLMSTLTGHTARVTSAVFSPDGQRIVTASEDSTARVWNVASGQLLKTFSPASYSLTTAPSATFSHNGRYILWVLGDVPRVWDADDYTLSAQLSGHSGTVFSASLSLDDQRIVTASLDKTARVWGRPLQGQQLETPPPQTVSTKPSFDGNLDSPKSNNSSGAVDQFNTSNDVKEQIAQLFGSLSMELPETDFKPIQASLEALREALWYEKGVAGIYTIPGKDRLHLILLTDSLLVHREIQDTTLNSKVFKLRELLQNPRSDVRPIALELYRDLVLPFDSFLQAMGTRTLVWKLDGALRNVPVGALYDGRSFLVEKYSLAVLSSASTHLTEQPSKLGRAIIFGVTKKTEPDFPSLPGVFEETREIQIITQGTLVLDDLFTPQSFQGQILSRQYSIVHLATRIVLGENIDQSSILFGNGDHLTFEDVKDGPISFEGVDLLVASWCETGVLRSAGDGSEVEGFSMLAERKGAKSVVATLWNVDDQSTAIIMPTFYKYLWAGATKADALRQAQLGMLKDNRYAHPFYWAPFVLSGNWR